ncbi:hypothetical protein TUM12370_14750 [Salmonella enterica subsp. enterica serovar Choleraesuis]|nr:hypothetical protein TUM12370_14750 [Salmonella enterica subsp. enterica serovar Choleraesuis]
MFSFDKLITPKIITVLYILTLIAFILSAIVAMVHGEIGTGLGLLVTAVFSRIFFECVMVAFKNNEYLRRIAESLESRPL